MLLRSLVVVGLVSLAGLAANARAEDAVNAAPPAAAVDGVNFNDPAAQNGVTRLRFRAGDLGEPRFAGNRGETPLAHDRRATRGYEVSVSHSGVGGLPVDVEFAQRAAIGVNENGDISRASRGSELRLGRGLGDLRRREASSWQHPIWYVFAAADDEALTWAPNAPRRAVALEDRVEIGDRQAGITLEAGPLQASLAYVEREVSTHVAGRSISHDDNFAGVTVTVRH